MTRESDLPAVSIEELSAALDEIYRLRRALAYEADVVDAHLSYATFPKSRRQVTMDQVERLRRSACGDAETAYAEIGDQSLRRAMKLAGASPTLTRWEWRTERKIAP